MMNLADALDVHARARPDHPALVENGAIITYAALTERVRRLASHVTTLVPEPNAVVGLCLADTARHVTALYALARAGRAILPMDLRWTASERASIAGHFGARLVLTEPGEPDIAGVPTMWPIPISRFRGTARRRWCSRSRPAPPAAPKAR
jgi:acyl-CoA synthetase (AMP-forming)/AMP-acid ligase II